MAKAEGLSPGEVDERVAIALQGYDMVASARTRVEVEQLRSKLERELRRLDE